MAVLKILQLRAARLEGVEGSFKSKRVREAALVQPFNGGRCCNALTGISEWNGRRGGVEGENPSDFLVDGDGSGVVE